MILSIIVPVYNVSQYLVKCLDSVLEQDVDKSDYEIIVVNDGSTDNSGEIAKEYADKFENIILINQINKGLSGARNTGIKAAKGKYIQFVDSDDFLEPNVEKRLLERMEDDDLDALRFNYQNVNENYEIFDPNKSSKLFVDFSKEVCDGTAFLNERLGFACYAVQFMLKAELLRPQENMFREGIRFEDTEWTPRILRSVNRVASIDLIVYNYLSRVGSITKCADESRKLKLLNDKLDVIEMLVEQMNAVLDKRWYLGMIAQTSLSIIGDVCKMDKNVQSKYLKELQRKSVFPLSCFHATKAARRKIHVANVSPELLCFLLRKRKR